MPAKKTGIERKSFRVEVTGSREERFIAAFVSPWIMLVSWGSFVAGSKLFANDDRIRFIYYEIVLSIFGFAALALVWGLLQPLWLDRPMKLLADRLPLTILAYMFLISMASLVRFAVVPMEN